MEIRQVFIEHINTITDKIKNSDCRSVLDILNGEVEKQKINDNYYKIILREVSDYIKVIIIDCKANSVQAISFNGTINISPKQLFEMFKNYREGYSIRDDLYFYFFNEDKKNGDYTLSFFDPLHKQVDIIENNEYLSNLTISLD